MGGVAYEGALLLEGALQALQDALKGAGERGQFRGGARAGRGRELPGIDGDLGGERGQLAQRKQAAVEQPGNERTGDEEKEEAAGGVELDRAANGMPDVGGGRAVKDGDLTELAAAVLGGVDGAGTLDAEQAVAVAVDLRLGNVAPGLGGSAGAGALPVARSLPVPRPLPVIGAAEEAALGVPDLVDVFGGDVQVGLVEHDVVFGIAGILDGAENGVGAAAEHDVEGAKVDVALVAEGEGDDEDGGEKLDGEDGDDEPEGDGAGLDAQLHWPGSGVVAGAGSGPVEGRLAASR